MKTIVCPLRKTIVFAFWAGFTRKNRIYLLFIFATFVEDSLLISKFFIYMGTDIKDSITTREKEILYLLSKGLNSKEIAAELFISAHTVE